MLEVRPDGKSAPVVPGVAGASTALTLAVGSAPFAAAVDGDAGPLDLHEELSHPDPSGGCKRWPAHFFLLSSFGEVVPGRCGASNLCDYCARLVAVENTEMLALDAMEGDAPQVWLVLTTRTATLDMSAFYKSRELLLRALRRRFPACEYASLLEFTRGYGTNSGGKRRPHWNVLLKGVTVADMPVIERLVADVWCPRVDALPRGQFVGEISHAGGLMKYIALHFQKESQAPPKGFRGQRFNCSRGYFTHRTRSEMRDVAKRALRFKRALHRGKGLGLEGQDLEDYARWEDFVADQTSWELWQLPNTGSGVIGDRPAGRDAPRKQFAAVVAEHADILESRRLIADLEAGKPNPPSEQLPLLAKGP